jgi:TonB-linked SusC/RagA family outer membrane protein
LYSGFYPVPLYPQQITVSGVVTDSRNLTLPGVTVSVEGTTQGTVTNASGEYSISNVPADATLVFSFVGMTERRILIDGQTTINVTMEQDLIRLDEVVAIGYGTRSRRFVTGSISSVEMAETRSLPNINVAQSLVNVPGVQFIGDARPGQSGAILIRGQNSLSADNRPLIVLDGIIFEGNITDINPQDIEAIDVLKDAASASIYGSRAANGVIMITSVTGRTERPSIQVSSFYGISEPERWIPMLTPERYIERRLDWLSQVGQDVDYNNPAQYLNEEERINYLAGRSVDVMNDIASQQGRIATLNASVSGRTERTNYLVSASASEDRGLVYNDQQMRYTVRANIDNRITDWLNIGIFSNFSQRDNSGVAANLNNAYRTSPFGTYFYEDGVPTQWPVPDEQAATNPLRNSWLQTRDRISENLFSNMFAMIEAPFLEGLSYRFNFSPNVIWNQDYLYTRQDPYLAVNNTGARKFNSKNFAWVLENIVTYDLELGESHEIDLTFLYGLNHQRFESTTSVADQMYLDLLGYNNLGLASIFNNFSDAWEKNGVSAMGRINYMFNRKYLATLTVRRDGSSVFAAENKYATFPSVALAWIASEEPFMANSGAISFLKFKASYGTLGNEAIIPYQSLSLAQTVRTVFGEDSPSILGVTTQRLGNDNLKWETVYSLNAGVEFGLFGGRLAGDVEVYNNDTRDLLVSRVIPETSGYSEILTNIGQTNNRGIDLTLNTINIQRSDFQWGTTAAFSYNRNQIVKLFGDVTGDGREDDVIANNWFIGQPIGAYYDYQFDGIYQVDDDIPAGLKPGDVRVADQNGDGQITAADRVIVGKGRNPTYIITFNNNLTYRNLSLFVSLNAMLDWIAPFNLINPRVPGRALSAIDAGWWTPENRSQTRPGLDYSNPYGTSWYVSRDFLRIRDVSLSYDFHRMGAGFLSEFTNLRLILSVKNLHTFTNWLGSDPEAGDDYTSEQGASNLFPMPRTYSLGLQVGF